jgi:predicted metal-dependent RNase
MIDAVIVTTAVVNHTARLPVILAFAFSQRHT